ncbi:MAG: UDP-N-acetylmuramoyl-L-alanyl-D-glutamate--2,6-diaminopimelate ligase, partial [Candidatus Subteraquimicrobiales bacterium]|nr:UDP-N-acetylmuramoyl-L-alanyl-D-glutamate--2,6-diaminopimelate ligase [Candidatus Subteraquimicrobiales bacterium]
FRGVLAYYAYGMPSKRLRVIGVTGTNGKTTTCHLIAKILEESGASVGMATTTTFKIGAKEWTNTTNITTMSPFALQKMLAQMVRAGCTYAVVETSSHAISQYRAWGIRYFAVALTNVTHEHLDYHKTFNEYVETKTKIFRLHPRLAVVNADDPNSQKFLHYPAGRSLTYGQENRADVVARKILPSRNGTIFTLVLPSVQITIDLHLVGLFNVSNALCASAVCFGLEILPETIKRGLEAVRAVPGRMEKIENGQDFTVMIDYAVTPDSLEKLYSTLKPATRPVRDHGHSVSNGVNKMIAVLGSCGDRDKTKRPLMGAVAGRFCDYVIVTDEEPYTEDPKEIIEQVASGVPKGKKSKMVLGEDYLKIDSRRDGIAKALSLAKRGDLVVITGMGAQEFRVEGHKHLPWSDKKVIKEELGKLGYNRK